jgi:hypothetical protein
VIVTVPSFAPVTTPAAETLATALLLDAHVTTRPVSTFPPASVVVAASVTVCPAMTVDAGGATLTAATGGGVTVTLATAVLPSLVAVTVAVPDATAVTTPDDDTVATLVALEVQVTTRPVSTLPPASFTVGTSVVLWPVIRFALAGATVTVATGIGFTVTVAVPDFPSLVAVIVAEPGATPVTSPDAVTVAIALLLELQVTTRSTTTAPLTSRTVVDSCVLPFCITDVAGG